MKTIFNVPIALTLILSISLRAMEIRNHCEEKEDRIFTETGTFNEDFLFLGSELDFSGEAEDLLFLGKRLTFSGKTNLGLLAFCQKLVYSGTSGNGIIAGGMEIVSNGTINGNSYIGCKSFTMSDKAVTNGNLFIGCAKLFIDGKLNGDLYAGAGEIVINNEINGNVTAYAGRITIGEKGKINGNLLYTVKDKMSDESLARISGTVKIDDRHKCKNGWNTLSQSRKNAIGFFIGFALFFSFIVTGCLVLLLPVFKKLEYRPRDKVFWKMSLIGLIPVLMYPASVVLCFLLIVTMPFAFILLLACIPLFFFANIIGSIRAGQYLAGRLRWNIKKRHIHFLIGVAAFALLSVIPVINFIVFIFSSSLGWGEYLSFIFNKEPAGRAPEAVSMHKE